MQGVVVHGHFCINTGIDGRREGRLKWTVDQLNLLSDEQIYFDDSLIRTCQIPPLLLLDSKQTQFCTKNGPIQTYSEGETVRVAAS